MSSSSSLEQRQVYSSSGSHIMTERWSNFDVISFITDNVNAYNAIHEQELSERLSPKEEKALDDIKTGKTKMITQSGEDFLKELNELVDE